MALEALPASHRLPRAQSLTAGACSSDRVGAVDQVHSGHRRRGAHLARLVLWTVLISTLAFACQGPAPGPERTLARFPAASLEGVVARGEVALDAEVTADGDGSLRIDATGPTTGAGRSSTWTMRRAG